MMLEMRNYGEIFHNHRNCQDMRIAGTGRTVRHDPACLKNVKIRNGTIAKKSKKFETESVLK